jgi:hypothetical protein
LHRVVEMIFPQERVNERLLASKTQTERLDLKEVSVKMTFRYPKSRLVLVGFSYTGQIAAENGTGLVIGAIWSLAMPGHKRQVLENTM